MRTFKEFSHRESLSCLDERGKVYTMFLDIRVNIYSNHKWHKWNIFISILKKLHAIDSY